MRILAIRGENLASLAQPFAVELEAEPIRGAGIFAITGPTGAGKSTLLDAVCLALYDRLPRMDTAERGVAVGRPDETGQPAGKYDDVRNILRHGAGAGYAEVDFVGQDTRRYRARWEVNRARGRARGKLQNQRLVLSDLESGAPIGDKKLDTLAEIERRIGLSFDQFRRAVLLAQGDFDTFIKAGSRDRAELLERITGSEIYGRLSRAAFERAKREGQALRDIETQLGEHRPLAPEERQAAEAAAAAARLAVEEIEAERAALAAAQGWYAARDGLAALIAAAETARDAAAAQDAAAAPEREALARTRRAFALRAELEAAAVAARQRVAAEAAAAEARAAAEAAETKRTQAAAAAAASATERDAQRTAYEQIGPVLDEAKRLDTLIEAAESDLATRRTDLERQHAAAATVQSGVAASEAALAGLRQRRAADERWLAEHRGVEALAPRLAEVTADLAERARLGREGAAARQRLAELRRAAAEGAARRDEQEARRADLAAREQGLEERIAFARSVADAVDLAALAARRDAIGRVVQALDRADHNAAEARRAQGAEAAAAADAAKHEARRVAASAALATREASLPAEQARLAEARRSLDLSEAMAGKPALHLRLRLQPGEPCPVCGATEHRTAEVDRIIAERAAEDRRRVASLETALRAAEQARGRHAAEIAGAETALAEIAGRRAAAQVELDAARQRWREMLAALREGCAALALALPGFAAAGEPAALIGEAGAEPRQVLAAALAEIDATAKRASAAEGEARKLAAERETLRREYRVLSEAIAAGATQAQQADAEAAALGAALAAGDANRAALTLRLRRALDAVAPRWEDGSEEDSALADRLRGLVEAWREKRAATEAAAAAIAQHENDLAAGQARLATLTAAAQAAAEALAAKIGERAALGALRARVIDGRPVGEVRTEYRKRAEAAELASQAAEAARSAAEREAAARASDTAAQDQAALAAAGRHGEAEARLAERLAGAGLKRSTAEAAIARGEAWMASEASRLEGLVAAVAEGEATLAERRRAAAEHAATGAPAAAAETIAPGLDALAPRAAAAADALLAAHSVLRRDDETRTRLAEIEARLAERRAAAKVWTELDQLIGSADGAKFRRFAQSLTLNHLIRLANRHLAELQPRYALQRAPGSDLMLQVTDHDMADEARGVHNLSGGERFLVSLALALGLASLSSGRGIRVDSLFIDEGFGALDSASLAMAVSVLEQLQATGRRVGVISHVEELKERIAVKVVVTPEGGGRSTLQVVVG